MGNVFQWRAVKYIRTPSLKDAKFISNGAPKSITLYLLNAAPASVLLLVTYLLQVLVYFTVGLICRAVSLLERKITCFLINLVVLFINNEGHKQASKNFWYKLNFN